MEENSNTQHATSNIETADEVEQQQSTQQLLDGSSGIVITTRQKATKKRSREKVKKREKGDDDSLLDYYGRFDGRHCLYILHVYTFNSLKINKGSLTISDCTIYYNFANHC